MTTLEATIEIVKASLIESKHGLTALTDPEGRARLLEGIAALYDKLEELENARERFRD